MAARTGSKKLSSVSVIPASARKRETIRVWALAESEALRHTQHRQIITYDFPLHNFITIIPQIAPARVLLPFQSYLSPTIPFLELFLSYDGLTHIIVQFIINKTVYIIFFRKPFGQIVSVLFNTLNEVTRYTNIQGALVMTRQNIHTRCFGHVAKNTTRPVYPISPRAEIHLSLAESLPAPLDGSPPPTAGMTRRR